MKIQAWVLFACEGHADCMSAARRALVDDETHPTLREGSDSAAPDPQVLLWQMLLRDANLKIDGRYGSATAKATRAFQSEHFRTPEGTAKPNDFNAVVGPRTWAKMAELAGPDAMTLQTVLVAVDETTAEAAIRNLVQTLDAHPPSQRPDPLNAPATQTTLPSGLPPPTTWPRMAQLPTLPQTPAAPPQLWIGSAVARGLVWR